MSDTGSKIITSTVFIGVMLIGITIIYGIQAAQIVGCTTSEKTLKSLNKL